MSQRAIDLCIATSYHPSLLQSMATSTIATTHATSTSSANICSDRQPKRVILRLRVNEFEGDDHNWEQYVDAINTYLVWAGRSMSEYEGEFETRKHFAHVEPFQAPELNQTTFHVVLDIEQHLLNEPNFDTLPHEIYRVRRDKEGNL